ncbi:MAG: sodium:solute symporter [Candidatus Thermoplasmatota archaeon]|jgi:SSS family solute:Na+ symporter|nr:sodium:solute symporter [Candidatus Thermoplasmatota archaeon]
MDNAVVLGVFLALFAVFVILGFWASRFRRGDLSDLGEWSLAGRKLGVYLAWFLVGADLYTAYTFIAIPESVYLHGAIYYFAVPYVGIAFGVAMITMPRMWKIAKDKNYVTAVDMIHDKFNSRTLALLIALTGIVAELPYIALQIYGMQAVLIVMVGQLTSYDVTLITELSLVLAFIILAAFTFTSGLRGATITAVMKDAIILGTVIVAIIAIPIALGGFGKAISAFANGSSYQVPPFTGSGSLAPLLMNAFISLSIMSALALYLYPHAINGVLSIDSTKKIRLSTALLPLYGIGLAFLALFGVLIYSSQPALAMVKLYGPTTVVPALIYVEFPDWFVGIAFLGIFIGGLVPASIMAISQANLAVRNVIKPYWPNIDPKMEARLAKWLSVIFKFIALGFIFLISPTFALGLQLVGGIIILQTLPAIFLPLYTDRLEKVPVGVGWAAGLILGVYMLYGANFVQHTYTTISTVLFDFSTVSWVGFLYIAFVALLLNLLISVGGSYLMGMIHGSAKGAAGKSD